MEGSSDYYNNMQKGEVDETLISSPEIEKSYILSQEMEIDKKLESFSPSLSTTQPPVTPDTDEESDSTPDDRNSKFIVVDDDNESPSVTIGEVRSKDYFHQTYENHCLPHLRRKHRC